METSLPNDTYILRQVTVTGNERLRLIFRSPSGDMGYVEIDERIGMRDLFLSRLGQPITPDPVTIVWLPNDERIEAAATGAAWNPNWSIE